MDKKEVIDKLQESIRQEVIWEGILRSGWKDSLINNL